MVPLNGVALAEEVAVTTEEAAIGGAVLGMGAGVLLTISIIWAILIIIADWKIFSKAGQSGWKSIIPFLREYTEYGICWKAPIGLIYAVLYYVGQYISTNVQNPSNAMLTAAAICGVAAFVISIKESLNLAKAFGKGTGFGVGLILLAPIFRLILGFGGAKYVGNPDA